MNNNNLSLCKAHKQEWKQSEYAAHNCDYCKALAKINELEAENARLRKICDPQTELEALELLASERKQAARECVEIMAGEYKRLGSFVAAFNTSMCAIKDHFGLGE